MRALIDKIKLLPEKRKELLASLLVFTVICGFSGYYYYYYQFIVGTNYITEPQIAFYNLGYKSLIVAFDRQIGHQDNGITLTDMDGKRVFGESMNYMGFMNGKHIYRADFKYQAFPNETSQYKVYLISRNKHFATIKMSNDSFSESDARYILSFFRSQRCGTELPPKSNCHTNDIFNINGTFYNLTGGWHAGGDYNKISFTTAYTLYILLDIYERTGNNSIVKQELKEEIIFGLNWLIKMQDPIDGGVFNKIESSGQQNSQNVSESIRSLDTRKFTHVASLFSAVCAKASRLISEDLPTINLSSIAVSAWNFSQSNKNQHPISEEYEYPKDDSFFNVAAAELYRMSNDSVFWNYIIQALNQINDASSFEISGHSLGKISFLYTIFGLNESIDETIMTYLQRNFELSENLTPFGTPKINSTKGTNFYVLQYAFDCVKLFEITQNQTYLKRALDQFYWIVGNNPFRKSFIIGLAENPAYQINKPYTSLKIIPNGGMVHGPILNSGRIYEYKDSNTQECKKYNDATIENTAIALWMFTELMNATRYNRPF